MEQRADTHHFQMPNGSYPIDRCTGENSVHSAALLAHHSTTYSFAEVKAHVMKAKAALGCPDSVLPSTWTDGSSRSAADAIELRYTPGIVELRAGGGFIGGYAAMFNKPSKNLGGFVEQVRESAFSEARGRGWTGVVARFNHDPQMMLGSTASGTLRLDVDQVGLGYDVNPPRARADVVELVERGDVRHSSFAFRVVEQEWGQSEQGYPQRSLVKVQLFDVGPVVTPAYPDTTAAMRSLAEAVGAELEEVEQRAINDDLRAFFVRTDVEGQSKPQTFGTALLTEHLGTKRDPWA